MPRETDKTTPDSGTFRVGTNGDGNVTFKGKVNLARLTAIGTIAGIIVTSVWAVSGFANSTSNQLKEHESRLTAIEQQIEEQRKIGTNVQVIEALLRQHMAEMKASHGNP